MKISLSDHFTAGRLLRFTFPSIIMMVFTSIYGVVDGLFVANVTGSNSLSSINIVMPLIMIVGSFGFMLGAGGSAEVAKTLGEGDKERANRYFTLLIMTILTLGVILSTICIIFIRPIAYLLGASEILIEDCVSYGTIILAGAPAFMLQTTFQTFFSTAEKPKIGLLLTTLSGVTNIFLDFLFVYVLRWGINGAAIATVIGYAVGGIIPVIYFILPNKSNLRLTRTGFYPRVLLKAAGNGSSEMLSNISMSVITFLYNLQMMKMAGENGVAAITVIEYVTFVFISILIGFSMGSAPIVGYNYGAGNKTELHGMFKKCLAAVGIISLLMFTLAEALTVPLVSLFVGGNPELFAMAERGMRLYSIGFLFCGLNIYGSSFFTALCNGVISATISFLRAFLLQAGMILLLPLILGIDGVWLAVVVSEGITAIVTITFLATKRKKYGYA